MNLSEIDLDFNAVGAWPLPVKAAVATLICAMVMVGGFYFDTRDQLAALDSAKQKEQDLRGEFKAKQNKAVNFQDYQDQLTQIEASLDEMIRQMPTEEEVASLLVDISQTGLASGLEFKLFKPDTPVAKDFYSELPISIQVVGSYEELGLFVSGLASLPRIVTLHDVNITPGKDGLLLMNAVIKSYNENKSFASSGAAKKKKRGN